VVLVSLFVKVGRANRLRLVRFTVYLFVVPGLTYFVWRAIYFGWLFPNTFYVKFGHIFNGLEWLFGSLGTVVGVLLVILLGVVVTQPPARQSRQVLYYSAFFLVCVVPYCLSSTMMNYMNRYLYHLLPAMFTALALSLAVLTEALTAAAARQRMARWVVPTGCLVLCLLPLFHQAKRELAYVSLYSLHMENAHIALANSLREATVPPALRTVAMGDVGALPYYSGWKTYDFVGLTNETVAHQWSSKSQYIATQRPSVLILYSRDGRQPEAEQFGFRPGIVLDRYSLIDFIEFFPNYYLATYLRRDLPPDPFTELERRITAVGASSRSANHSAANRRAMLAHLSHRIRGAPVLSGLAP
jgi:hypothetical protein